MSGVPIENILSGANIKSRNHRSVFSPVLDAVFGSTFSPSAGEE